ncbi:MFS transporter [Streptomyces sp. NPDC058683]|uniref:MFS transporter n=1 Tax=Streptomyces sp. NPDC058683 TaxID=3346597 RepID=UPI0036535960
MSNETSNEARVEAPRTTVEAEVAEGETPDARPLDAQAPDAKPEGAQAAADVGARLARLPFTGHHLRTAIILALGGIGATFGLTAMNEVKTALRDTLHISLVQAGWAGAIAIVGSIVGERLTAVFAQRLAPRRALALSLVAYGTFSSASGLAWDYTSLLAFRALFGLGVGAMIFHLAATVRESIGSPRQRALATGVLICPAFGFMSSPMVASAARHLFSDETAWRVTVLAGGFPLLVGLYALARWPESPRWLAAHGRYAEADRMVRGIEDSLVRKGVHLEEPRSRPRVEIAPRVPKVLSHPYARRTLACVALGLGVLLTHNMYFK